MSRASRDYWRWQPNEPDLRAEQISTRAREMSSRAGAGLTDEALRGFAGLQNLRRLDLSGGRFDTAALAALRDLASLRSLDLYSVHLDDELVDHLPATITELGVSGERSDRFCGAVRERFRDLEVLDLAGCDEITDAGIAELVQLPRLRRLDIRQCRGLTPACLESLMRAQQLEQIDLRHIGWPTAAHAQRLRQALPRLREVLVNE